MKKLILLLSSSLILLSSCADFWTRTETDLYTITERDTTRSTIQKNAPGVRDNGIIYPSSREELSERYLVQRDSVVNRYYPNFIRLGLFESVGLIGTGGDKPMGVGILGIFPDFVKVPGQNKDYVFSGGLYRIGIGEWRLRWFRDAKDWTWGLSLFEAIAPENRIERVLIGTPALYIRKRFFLKEEIPYVCITPAFGFALFPSIYMNLSGSIDVGSIGGLNIRGYIGIATGINSAGSGQVAASDLKEKKGQSITFPYAGIGVSFLDFLNRVKETNTEWKDHEHSAWNIGLLDIALVNAFGAESILSDDTTSPTLFDGFILRVANASVALPFGNNQFYLGTSLLNLAIVGKGAYGMGMLPFRAGYWQTLIADELSTEPFIEYNYYPSTFIHIGNRLNLRISDMLNISLLLGYLNGSTASKIFTGEELSQFGIGGDFSQFYIGVNLGISNRIFFPQQLRYNR